MKKVPVAALDELAALANIAEDKQKIALVDLFRLLVLEGSQAEYFLTKHGDVVNIEVIETVLARFVDLKDDKAF